MSLKDMQARLQAMVAEGQAIAAKDQLAPEDQEKLEELVRTGTDLRGQMELVAKHEGLTDWANQSGGMLPLAANTPATAHGARKSGEAILDDQGESILVNSEGEPLLDDKTFAAIGAPEYKSAFRRYLRQGIQGVKADDLKALQEGLDVSGGYLVPPDILNRLIAKDPAPTNVAARVTRLNTSRDAMTIPRVTYTTDDIYTSGMRVTWTGEVPASATTHRVTEPTFGQIRIPVYTAMMSLPLTNDMIEDAAYPVVQWCTGKFEETIELLRDNMIINGTGVGQPSGILVNPNATDNPATVVSGATSTLTADGIIDLGFALPEQYDRNGAFVFNKTNSALAIAKLKDGDGRYLWGSGLQDSGLAVPAIRQRELLGYPVMLNAFMPNIAASAYPIIFGDLSGYYLINRVAFSIQVLRELYAETNQVLLLGRVRFGGVVVEPWRMKIQQVGT